MTLVGARIPVVLPVLLGAILTLPGCTTIGVPPPVAGALRGCADRSARLAPARWWACLGDAQLSALIERALEPDLAPTPALDRLTAAIARRYIALRAQQSALVLLAAREELDSQPITMAGQPVAAAAAQLAATRTDQARTRAQIAALQVELAVLTGSAPDTLDRLPGGPIPLPPAPLQGAESYAAAQGAAARAQSVALSAVAAAQTIRARTEGTVPSRETLAADRRALDALQAEQQARAAMTEAYVLSLGRDAATR